MSLLNALMGNANTLDAAAAAVIVERWLAAPEDATPL